MYYISDKYSVIYHEIHKLYVNVICCKFFLLLLEVIAPPVCSLCSLLVLTLSRVCPQLKDLSLLDRCLKETLRLRPPIMTMMRMARSPQVGPPDQLIISSHILQVLMFFFISIRHV